MAPLEADNPGVAVRPPLLSGAAFLAVLVLRWFWPMSIVSHSSTLWPGLILLLAGVTIIVPGRRALMAAGTNVDPSLPTALLYLGLTLAFNTWWGVVLLVPILIVVHLGVVLREERYLEQTLSTRRIP
jgi:hypothetical protein